MPYYICETCGNHSKVHGDCPKCSYDGCDKCIILQRKVQRLETRNQSLKEELSAWKEMLYQSMTKTP